jgi:hypothetical protein
MMARSTRKTASRSTSRSSARKTASKKSSSKKTIFQKMLTAEGWKRLMMGKLRKSSRSK